MRFIRLGLFTVAFLIVAQLSLPTANAQEVRIRRMPTVPASCDPFGISKPALVWKTSTTSDTCGTSKGLCECTATDTWTLRIGASATLVAKTFLYANASGLVTSTAAPTNGQLLVGSTGAIPVVANLTNTANETLITNGAGSITIGVAAAFQHQAGANFLLTDTTDITKKIQWSISGLTTGNTRTITAPDSNTSLPIIAQTITLSGPTAARTYTLPDFAGTFKTGNKCFLAADQTNATTTFASITGCSISVTSGQKYSFHAVFLMADSTAADGAKLDFNGGSATATNFRVHCELFNDTGGAVAQTAAGATTLAGVINAGAMTTVNQHVYRCEGTFEPSSTSTFIPRIAQNAHSTGTLTLFRGSHLIMDDY